MDQENNEKRYASDCRLMPSEKNCSLYIEGRKDEVMAVAMRHAIDYHGHDDTPELKSEIESGIKEV
jgi:hypothetical protein